MTRTSIVDFARSVCLCDVGLPGIGASVCVADDGQADLVLIDGALLDGKQSTYDPTTPQAPHEQTGPMPPRWRARVQLAPLRCGRRTKAGSACRTHVGRPGMPCHWHREHDAMDLSTENLGAKPIDLDD